ncbi:hypothetical protein CKM354_000033000 [Cercospora kikuchii]|uniref:Modin n=1 Tax=Cercospora kikuchii TaxID=84275 RepID=A0A9P3C3P1_9PEZI|nr:uncharacterized protein CKM354_000033000 [Cercospora kikuchii]GIZ36864.1 hypothetical protein CKM354_000033000 [Cercospora kikuchii]
MADNELIIAIVSLVIAIVAFIIATAQALQQFAASAEGYRLCGEGIMGLWGKKTKRVFTWNEFRFKVMMRTPILFVAPPNNTRGPVPERPVYNITGSLQSYEETHCRVPSQQADDAKAGAMKVHTADDEHASWVVFMEALQKAEVEGRQWDLGFSKKTARDSSLMREVPSTMVVQVQEKKRSWDQMPDAVRKPFATSNISHIVEMAALLGMQWVTFDQDTWNLRAEGNGYMLLSQTVWGLGVSLSFAVTGKASFAENRMIPCPAVKQMLFGSVETIFDGLQLNFEPKKAAWEDMFVTQRTLRSLKLDRKSIERYFSRKEHSVIRSVSFEMIAMLSKVFRIPGTNYKRLPNPTPDPWLNDLSACKIQSEFQGNIARMIHEAQSPSNVLARLNWVDAIWQESLQPVWQSNPSEISIDMRDAVQSAISAIDNEFLHTYGETQILFIAGAHVSVVLEEISDPKSFLHSRDCDTEEEIWHHYFYVIREKVINFQGSSVRERAVEKTGNIAALLSPDNEKAGLGNGNANGMVSKPNSIHSVSKGSLREEIWLMLMFRMSLWWLLHDFDEKDALILPPRLMGSRMPVYIL